MPKKDEKPRKRIVVEEIKEPETTSQAVEAEMPAQSEAIPAEKPKEPEGEIKSPEPQKLPEEKKEREKEETKEKVSEATSEKKSLWYIFRIMIPVAIVVGVLAGGVFYFLNSVSNTLTPSPTPIEITTSPTPSASPSAQIDLSKYSIKVLNGSGIAGQAGKVQDLLTSNGFKVSTTGNAVSYDYTDTIIQIGENVAPDFVAKLTQTLAEAYSVDSKTQNLSASETADVVIIVGSSKASP